MRLTHFGHACLLVEAAGARILIDPGEYSGNFTSLTDLQAILITHQHGDHVDAERLPALLAANPGAALIADPETADLMRSEVPGSPEAKAFTAPDVFVVDSRVEIRGVGQRHAFNHDRVPVCANTGFVISAEGEPTLFHPGDAYDAEPGRQVDVLALPLNAPWCAMRDTLDFLGRIGPSTAVPIHDALLSDTGRAAYLMHVWKFTPEGCMVRDLSDGKPWQVSRG